MEYIKDNTNILIYDFETDGFSPKFGNRPIQFGGLVLRHDGTVDKYQCLIKRRKGSKLLTDIVINGKELKENPDAEVKTIATLTGITDDILEEKGLEIEEAFTNIGDMFDLDNRLIAGHNIINFDNKFLNFRFHKYALPFSVDVRECYDTGGEFKAKQLGWKKFNNLSYSEYHIKALNVRRKGLKWNLDFARDYYEIDEVWDRTQHNALVDVGYTTLVLLKQLLELGEITQDYYDHYVEEVKTMTI